MNVDTGISDFHNLTGVISRAHTPQLNRRMITYRSMKNFNFSRDLDLVPFNVCEIFDDVNDIAWAQHNLLSSVIDLHAPVKRRFVRENQVPYINGELRKAIHQRNMWRNKHSTNKWDTAARDKYVCCRITVVKLMKSSVDNYFRIQCEGPCNSKRFFKTVKPFLSNNLSCNGGSKIMLNENDTIVTDATEIANIFNVFYGSIANYPAEFYDGLDRHADLEDVLDKHYSHDSIVSIRSRMGVQVSHFDFSKVSVNDVLKKIKSLKPVKSPRHDGIQDKFLKLAGENLACSLCVLFNTCIDSCIFPTSMKMADICPVYKKLDNFCQNNSRSVNLLTILSSCSSELRLSN